MKNHAERARTHASPEAQRKDEAGGSDSSDEADDPENELATLLQETVADEGTPGEMPAADADDQPVKQLLVSKGEKRKAEMTGSEDGKAEDEAEGRATRGKQARANHPVFSKALVEAQAQAAPGTPGQASAPGTPQVNFLYFISLLCSHPPPQVFSLISFAGSRPPLF